MRVSTKRRKFSSQFKAEAVQLVIESGRAVAEVARELQINEGTLGNWVIRYRAENPEPVKALSPLEAEALYREIKQLLAEDASRRQAASRFSTDNQPGSDGAAKLAAPSAGESRDQAAAMIPGAPKHSTLDKIGYLRDTADDAELPDELRQQARDGLAQIDAGGAVHPIYQNVRSSIDALHEDRASHLHALADEALARVKEAAKKPKPSTPKRSAAPARYAVRVFVMTWGELFEWWDRYDLDTLARELTDEQAEAFYATAEGTAQAAQKLRQLREQQPQLRAL